jgi:hypothetical protein
MTRVDDAAQVETRVLARYHLRFGWFSLLVFLSLGIALETLHGFKVGWYLDVANETRRHLLTLAHAHGTLLALVHVAFGLSTASLAEWNGARRRLASRCLIAASVLVPGGFFLGGLIILDGDPGPGIALLPFGALLLLAAVGLTALGTRRS